MDQTAPFAAAGTGVHYERRRPEETVLYQLVQEHLETFLAQECGLLAHGFLRLRCADCAHEKLVAFSCKRRGICPNCGARRMVETAAHLVDHVIPRVPVRQWVLSFPIPLRVARRRTSPPTRARVADRPPVISTFLVQQAGLSFGSAANLNKQA